MLEVALLQQMPAQIPLMAALHYDYHRAGLGIVHSSAHRHIPPVDRRHANRIGRYLVEFVRIVAYDTLLPRL